MIKSFLLDLFNIVQYEFDIREKEAFEYFKEIALKSEFGYSPDRIIKWTKPMKAFIKKEKPLKTQVSVIKQTIERINELATDGFRIELIDNIYKCDTIIYLNSKSKVNEIDKYFFKGINEDFAGLADIEYDSYNFNILKGKIFIDTNESLEIQKAAIIEEITQSIGLMNDSEMYSDSTFYQNKDNSRKKYYEYTDIDKELIKLLYLPSIKPGYDDKQIEKKFKRYYKSLKNK
jgi:hypothetical protein